MLSYHVFQRLPQDFSFFIVHMVFLRKLLSVVQLPNIYEISTQKKSLTQHMWLIGCCVPLTHWKKVGSLLFESLYLEENKMSTDFYFSLAGFSNTANLIHLRLNWLYYSASNSWSGEWKLFWCLETGAKKMGTSQELAQY